MFLLYVSSVCFFCMFLLYVSSVGLFCLFLLSVSYVFSVCLTGSGMVWIGLVSFGIVWSCLGVSGMIGYGVVWCCIFWGWLVLCCAVLYGLVVYGACSVLSCILVYYLV